MNKYKIFFLTEDKSPEAEAKHPSEREDMFAYDIEAANGEEAVGKARMQFDLEHGAPHIHIEGISILDM